MSNDMPETPPTAKLLSNSSKGSPEVHLEVDRLHDLADYGMLNDELKPILDILCEHAAAACEVPIGAITLIDHETIMFLASHGIGNSQGERKNSFCTHALLAMEKVFIIPDTVQDHRFAGNPQVTSAPFIRFYAAVPLMNGQGRAIGCFCVMDTKPGALNEDQVRLLIRLSELTISMMEKEKLVREQAHLMHLEKEVYNKMLLSSADLALAATTFDDALHSLIINLDQKLGWLSARIRNMQTGGTTGIYYNETLPYDAELPLIWNRLDTNSSQPIGVSMVTTFVNSAPLRTEYSHLAVPVRIRDRLVAVLELLYPDHHRHDPRINEVFNLIAVNLAIVAERELVNVELKDKSRHDLVTHAATREYFIEILTGILDELKYSTHQSLLLFCFIINDFQSINDDFGYETSIQLLKQIAWKANRLSYPQNLVGRLMGGEFLLLLHVSGFNNDHKTQIKRVVNLLNGEYQVGDTKISVRMSIGCVVISTSETPPPELIRQAEEAMHLVKSGVHLGICIADAEVLEAFEKRKSLDRKVKEAVSSNRMTLYYQPIIEIESGRIAGAEALLRLVEKDGSITAAENFIPALERTRLLPQVDEWVFSDILKTLTENSSLLESLPEFYISHNVSPELLAAESFNDRVISQLQNEHLDPKFIHVEITEKALLQNSTQVMSNLKLLKDIGILVALDDFGTGYSNLQFLTKFSVDIIKIDRSFLAGIVPGHKQLNSLLSSITDIASNFGCAMIAEGLEKKQDAEKLLSLGCRYAQGYLYGRPMPFEEFKIFAGMK